MYIVLLSGGSGQRLWPLSNDLISKQYIKLIGKEHEENEHCSMLQRVWDQLEQTGLSDNTIIVASQSQLELIQSQVKNPKVAIEPGRRDTFPAIALSCAYLIDKMKADGEDTVAVLPVDPYTEQLYFETIKGMEKVLCETNADIALMGALPTYDSEKYGYIIPDKNTDIHDNVIKVSGFVEKPSAEKAHELVNQGAIWNCGIFCFKLNYIERIIKKYVDNYSYDYLYSNYGKLPKISFDYEVLEKADNLVAVKYDGLWKDLGTWNTLTEEMNQHQIGNIVWDHTSKNSHAINMLDIPMVIMGAENIVVAATYDGILVADKNQSSFLKDCLKKVSAKPRYEERAWGTIKTIDIENVNDDIQIKTNKIKVNKNMYTTYHLHSKHDEIITILSGKGILIKDGVSMELTPGTTVHICANSRHAIKAITTLKYIEVLQGELDLDDITRFEYDWDNIITK